MSPVRPLKSLLAVTIAASLSAVFAASTACAASTSARKPVILDSQSGINDGQSGTVLQTAPLSRQPIVEAQPIATPAELAPNSSIPIIVAPYIQLPAGGGMPPPQPQPRPVPRPQ
ncbi:hypothetical protein [Paraburkholderia sediminicola]|jgi:hypothetical protein|uniref:hypothetical protein n=1 Tax=Paraburkholderia sediminicola TaxID=458836 RepID=UPI0038B807E8